MNIKHFKGLIAATFTPFHDDGSLNLEIISDYAARLKEDGVKGVFICGSSGEGLLMETEERKLIAEAWMPFSEDQFRIIVHVGSTSLKTAKDLASHAASIKAYAIGCMGPCCFQPRDEQSLTAFCKEVAFAAHDLPFYYYHIPSTSGVHVKMSSFLKTAEKVIPNLAGIKFTDSDMMDMMACMSLENSKYDILHGHDETLLAGMVLGAQSAIGTTFNFLAPAFNRLIRVYQEKRLDEALSIQKKINEIIAIMLSTGSPISGGKAMMKLSGLNCGPCRLPLSTLSEAQQGELNAELKRVDYFKLIEGWTKLF